MLRKKTTPHFDITAYWRGNHWELHLGQPHTIPLYLAPDDNLEQHVTQHLQQHGHHTNEEHLTFHYPQA